MTDLFNRFTDGWLTLLVLEVLDKHDVLRALELAPAGVSVKSLAQACAANEGHLRVALRLLLEMGCLVQLANGHYAMAPHTDLRIPADSGALARLAMSQALGEPAGYNLRSWLERSAGGWEGVGEPLATCLDGALLAPLLMALEHLGGAPVLEGEVACAELSRCVQEALHGYFEQRAWGRREGGGFRLGDSGRSLLEESARLRSSLDFQSLLGNLPTLLFGDASSLHGLGPAKAELWPVEYMAALETAIVTQFDQPPLDRQPRYILEMGCTDGVLLRRLHVAIASRSLRGRHLQHYPLLLIGVTTSSTEQARVRQTLEGLPHLVLTGDISDPRGLLDSLGDNGIQDPESVLHIHAFQEHRRAWQAPVSVKGIEDQRHTPPVSVHVGRSGEYIEPAVALQGMVEHLARWHAITAHHGLMLLAAHCLDPASARRHAGRSGALHFDACHGFAGHQLYEAPVLLMAAAQAGLFPDRAVAQGFPHGEPFTQASLNRLLPRHYRIRHPLPRDLPHLRALELACWPGGLGATEQVLLRRLEIYPQGQLVMECEGQIVAAIYSQRLDSVERLRHSDCLRIEAWHDPAGPIAQLLGICVHPGRQGEGLADELIDFMLVYLASLSEVRSVVGVTRCHHYDARQPGAPSLQDYIRRRDEACGRLLEPMLCFHESHGAQVREVLDGYRPGDEVNHDAGVLVEYPDLRAGQPVCTVPTKTPEAAQDGHWRETVGELLLGVLGEARADAYGEHVPLMEMGLTSLQMLDLRHRLAERLACPLPATFFSSMEPPRRSWPIWKISTPPLVARWRKRLGRQATQRPLFPAQGASPSWEWVVAFPAERLLRKISGRCYNKASTRSASVAP
ncbi:hypothetical protein ACP9OK_15445 [Pseudomonas sp. B11]